MVVVKKMWTRNPGGTTVVDHFIPDYHLPGFSIPPVDGTAFSINYLAWLYEFDIANIFLDDALVQNVPVKNENRGKRIVVHEKQGASVCWRKEIEFHAKSENKTFIGNFTQFKVNVSYIFMPEDIYFYKGILNVKEIRVKRRF